MHVTISRYEKPSSFFASRTSRRYACLLPRILSSPPPPANSTRVQLSRFPHRNFPSRPRAAFHLRPIPQSRLSCYFLECVWATEDFSPPTSSGAAPAVAFPKTMRILRYARLALQPLLVFPKRIEWRESSPWISSASVSPSPEREHFKK